MQMMHFAVAAVLMCGTGSNGQLDWKSHYGDAKKAAQASGRPLLVVLDNPDQKDAAFDDQTLTGKDHQVELMKNYLLCRVDVSTPYGKRVAAALRAEQFPYTVITDKTATFITFRQGGKMSSEEWNAKLESHKMGETRVVSAAFTNSHGTYRPVTVEPTPTPTTSPAVIGHGAEIVPVQLPVYQSPGFCPQCIRPQYR
jgi:hypothetical protein